MLMPSLVRYYSTMVHHELYIGLVENDYYTVVFGVSRALGCLSNGIMARVYGLPIERPNSIDIATIQNLK